MLELADRNSHEEPQIYRLFQAATRAGNSGNFTSEEKVQEEHENEASPDDETDDGRLLSFIKKCKEEVTWCVSCEGPGLEESQV